MRLKRKREEARFDRKRTDGIQYNGKQKPQMVKKKKKKKNKEKKRTKKETNKERVYTLLSSMNKRETRANAIRLDNSLFSHAVPSQCYFCSSEMNDLNQGKSLSLTVFSRCQKGVENKLGNRCAP